MIERRSGCSPSEEKVCERESLHEFTTGTSLAAGPARKKILKKIKVFWR